MRKAVAFLGLMIWVLSLAGPVFASSLSLSPSSGTFNQSCNFSLDVILDTEGIDTDGTDAIISYDSTRFIGQSIINGTLYPDFPGNNMDNAAGKITISGLAGVNTPFKGKGTLATINFAVQPTAASGAAQVNFDFDPADKAKTTDSNVVERGTVADTLNSVVNGSYVIGSGSCKAVKPSPSPQGGPAATPSAAPFPTPGRLPEGGTAELTSAMAIIGGILTVLGILGFALL